MRTMEHLFMQIFERKDWIAGQLTQQSESVSQSQASNLLAAGRRLPPWLWTAAAGSDCWDSRRPQELNREQIISGNLYTPQRDTMAICDVVFSGKLLRKDVHVPQSKSFVAEKCVTTPFSVPHCYPGDNEHQDIVVDSIAKIQESSPEQGGKQVNLGKKGKSTDGLSKQRSGTEYTGRITRSRATSMEAQHVKESVDLKILSKFPVAFDVADPRMFTQRDTYYNDSCETGREACSSASLKPSSDAHVVSLPPPDLDITNSAASLPPYGNTNPAQPCLNGIVNNEYDDAPDAVHHTRSRAKATSFTYSSEIFSNVEPRQLVSSGIDNRPLSGVFDTLGKENQCPLFKIGNSRLEPLESLVGEVVSQAFEKADSYNSLLGAKLTSDSVAAGCNAPSELNIVDSISSTCPHFATYVESEPALSNIKARASNEKFDMCLQMEHQNTSPKAAVIKPETALSTHGESFVSSFRGKDDSSMAVELQDKLHTAKVMDEGEEKTDTVVHEGQEEKCVESLEVEKPEIRYQIVSCNHNTPCSSSLSSIENLHGNSLACTASSKDGTLKCFLEFSGRDASEQDDNGSSLIEIPPHLAMEGEDIGAFTAEATNGTSKLEIAECIDGSETSGMFLEAEKTQDGVQEVAEGSSSQQARPSVVEVHNQLLENHCFSQRPTPFKKTAGYTCEEELEAKNAMSGEMPSTDKNYDQQGQSWCFLRSSSGCVNTSCKSNVSVLSSTHKHDISSKAEEIETSASLRDALVKSDTGEKSTVTAAEVCNTQFRDRYLLRSSSGPNKDVAASKFSLSNDSHCSSESREAIFNTSEIRYSKRRKLDNRHNNSFGSSPELSFKSLRPDQDGNCSLKKGPENHLGTCEPFPQCQILKEVEKEPYSCHKNPLECLHQSKKPQTSEDDFDLKRQEDRMSSSLLQHMQEESYLDCHVGGQADKDFKSSIDDLEINESPGSPLVLQELVASKVAPNMPDIPNTLIHEHLESTYIEQIMNKTNSNEEMKCQFLLSSAGASHSGDRDLVIPDEAIPELEGFSIESPIMGNEFIFDDPNLQKLTRERASALEQLRRSLNIPTAFSCFSTKHSIHRVPHVCQSLPDELLLKCMSLDDHLQSSGTDGNDCRDAKDGNLTHIHWKTVTNFDISLLEKKSDSHSSPLSSAQFFHNDARGLRTPPVEKFPQKVFLERKGCGLDRIASNPVLTCFRIDEHARSLEENVCREEYQDRSKERLCSRERGFSPNRKPLADVTSIYQNAAAIVSTEEKGLDHSILGSVETDFSFLSEMNDNKNLENNCGSLRSSKVENKENGFLSASRNKVQKAVVSVHNRLSKVSMKTGEQKRIPAILENKASNIVSDISTFVSLVRQKQQAAAPITGKRKIKVKALEAAENAKRIAEERENERKMRKEAASIARRENARQLESKQKQKEAKKKKEANIPARKRQREDEERKENQRKRNCIKGVQRQRKDSEERAQTEGKYPQHMVVEEKECKREVLLEEAGIQHKAEKGQNVAKVVKIVEVDPDHTHIPGEVRNVNNSLQSHKVPKDSKTSHKVIGSSSELPQTMQDGNVMLKENRQSESYEISPYRDSDDEDGEDDKKHKKKFVPSWARRESLDEHLLSMRHLDPTKIFCRKKSFDLTEVLSLQTRQRAF